MDSEHIPLDLNGGPLEAPAAPLPYGAWRAIPRPGGARPRVDADGATSRDLGDHVDDATIAVDPRFRVTAWSSSAERMYGWTEAEALGHDVGRFIRFEMDEASRAEMRRRTVRDGHSRVESVAVRKDGTRMEVELNTIALRDGRGRLTGFIGIHRDVRQRNRALGDQQRLAAIVENASDLVGFADLDGRMLYVNEAGRRLVGLGDLDDVRRTEIADYVAPEDRAFLRERLLPEVVTTGRRGGDGLGGVELLLRHLGTGATLPALWDIVRIDDAASGEPIGLATVARDISERRAAEDGLRRSQRRIETVLESITDAFYALDHDGRFTYLNARAVEMLSALKGEPQTSEDFLGKRVWDEFPSAMETAAYAGFAEAVRDRRTVALQYRYPADGPWWDVHVYPSDEGLSVYVRDITERRRAELERENRARQQALVAALGQRALAGDSLGSLMAEAVEMVAGTLHVELAAVAELLPAGDQLLLRAGVGWRPGAVGTATEPAGRGSQAGCALLVAEPVVAGDLGAEGRFRPSALVREHGAVSAATVVIAGRERPFGVLGALATRPRQFSPSDVSVLQAVADVLGVAVARQEAAQALSDVREVERRRIARDLHDEALRDVTYALAQADLGRRGRSAASDAARLEALVPALERVGGQLKGAIYGLRLAGQHDQPFADLLEGLVDVHRAMSVDAEIDLDIGDGLAGSLGATGTEVLRVVGEALTNARRHSGARHVRVSARASGDRLRVEVADDGCGFDPATPSPRPQGTGMKAMRERADLIGADLQIRASPAGGTRVRLDLVAGGEPVPGGELVRVLLVEDHVAVRQAIGAAFEREPDFAVVGQAASLAEARTMLDDVDVAVLDLGLPDGYGGDLIADLRDANPRCQALVLSAMLDRGEMARAIAEGAAGLLDKTAHLDDVVDAVRRLRAGESLVPVEEVVDLLRFAGRQREGEHRDRQAIAQLTARERDVLQALAQGLDSQAIADRLHITLRTERNHVANILAKLGVHSQLQAVVFALRYDAVQVRRGPADTA